MPRFCAAPLSAPPQPPAAAGGGTTSMKLEETLIFWLLALVATDSSFISCSSDEFCSFDDGTIQTPTNDTAVPVVCNYSLTEGLDCTSISFYVVVDGLQSRVMLAPSSDLFWNNSFECDVPDNQTTTSTCGIKSFKNLSLCTASQPGCQVYRIAVRIAKKFAPFQIAIASSPRVCFFILSSLSLRCVKIFVNIGPSEPVESRATSDFAVYLGQSISLQFSSSQWIASRSLVINVQEQSLLQQNSGWKWQGPTFCRAQNRSQNCTRSNSDNWMRELIFRPTPRDNATMKSFTITALSAVYPESPQGISFQILNLLFTRNTLMRARPQYSGGWVVANPSEPADHPT